MSLGLYLKVCLFLLLIGTGVATFVTLVTLAFFGEIPLRDYYEASRWVRVTAFIILFLLFAFVVTKLVSVPPDRS